MALEKEVPLGDSIARSWFHLAECCGSVLSSVATPQQVPGTNGTVRLGSERKFSSGTWKIFVILPRALAIDDDFKNLPWLKSRTFLASSN